jgi:hypothetical protein
MKSLQTNPASWCLPVILLLALSLFAPDDASAQRRKRAKERRADPVEEAVPASTPAVSQSLVDALRIVVYPAADQSPEQQELDETECSAWAQTEVAGMSTGSPTGEPSAEADSEGRRDRNRSGGALKGAAVGAVVGEALDDEPEISRGDVKNSNPGKNLEDADSLDEARRDLEQEARQNNRDGAEVGAAVGAVAGRRRQKKAEQGAAASAEAASASAVDVAESDSLKAAMKVCLEARDYSVDY